MALIVQKFGGTSMGSLDRIQHVASRVMHTSAQGHQVVVVVSAMSGETDRLIQLAKSLTATPDPREYDVLVSTGEQASMALLAMALLARGCPAKSYTASQLRIITDACHKKARILTIECDGLRRDLNQGRVAIVAGFQGVTADGDISTLGRGGSDTTAVALAAALQADECHIYTDVDGVYTADPRVVPEARHLSHITFQEMLELSSLGAKVLQFRSVECAAQHRVPLRVLSTFTEGPGTLISFTDTRKTLPPVSGIAHNKNEACLTLRGLPAQIDIAAKVLKPISQAGIDVDMIVQHVNDEGLIDFTFTLERDDYPRAYSILSTVTEELGVKEVLGNVKIAKISLVGVGMRSNPGIATKMFAALGEAGIGIELISTSEITISVLVPEELLEVGVRTLHATFRLEREMQPQFTMIVNES